jgi:hypothetical protein
MPTSQKIAATPGHQVFQDGLALFHQGKTDELIDRFYKSDAVLITASRTIHGHGHLKPHFRALASMLGKFELLSLDSFMEAENAVLVEKTIRTAAGDAKVYDAFVFEEWKVSHHFTGVR